MIPISVEIRQKIDNPAAQQFDFLKGLWQLMLDM